MRQKHLTHNLSICVSRQRLIQMGCLMWDNSFAIYPPLSLEYYEAKIQILSKLVQLKALEIAKNEKYGIPAGQFKAGNHWCQHFMKRNGLSLWQKTTLAQRFPEDYKEIVQFHLFLTNLRKEHNYPLHAIANMDEMQLTFGMPPIRTINNTREKAIKIRTTGNKKNCVTVVLACARDRSKLRPMVIFKRKTVPKVANKHGVVITAQEKGWMDVHGKRLQAAVNTILLSNFHPQKRVNSVNLQNFFGLFA